MSMWSDDDILSAQAVGDIRLEPFVEDNVQPASVDLRLGNVFWRFKELSWWQHALGYVQVLDPREPVTPLMERVESEFITLPPKGFLLGVTIEKISLGPNVVARVEGKSSLGRMGLTVHSTAGFIDPGNKNLNITMELYNQSPLSIRLYSGMKICQLAFQYTISTCRVPYGPLRRSRYYGDSEPVPSRVNENL